MNIAWIAFTLMVAIAAVGITIPLVRRYDSRRQRTPEAAVLGAQLAEIDGQAAAGALGEETAESLKTETIRRFLAESPADPPAGQPLGGRGLIAVAVGLAAVVAIGATLLYTKLGRPDLAVASAGGTPSAEAAGADGGPPAGHVAGMIAQLEAKMKQSPNDPEGWRMLGWSYGQTGRYGDSAAAYARAASLNPTNADYPSAQGEALVKAAEGQVTPEARKAFATAYRLDPTDPRARYFLAAAKDQAGDHAGAMNDWIALLKSAPPGAPWAAEVRGFVTRIAASRGEDVTGRLPPLQAGTAPEPAGPGPSPPSGAVGAGGAPAAIPRDEADRMHKMTPDEQQAMIHNMVDTLAAKLKADPNNPTGWASLIHARMVLNDPKAALQAYRDGVKALPDQKDMLTQQARQSRVPGF